MKIKQKPKFQPITIVLETAEEADTFWDMCENSHSNLGGSARRMAIKLSDAFSGLQTGGESGSLFEKNTTKTEADGRVMIRCNKGLWSVDAPSEYEAMREAVRYYIQYAEDGEYDE